MYLGQVKTWHPKCTVYMQKHRDGVEQLLANHSARYFSKGFSECPTRLLYYENLPLDGDVDETSFTSLVPWSDNSR